MDNIVSLNNTKENLFEFDLSIEGIKPKDMTTKFVIRANGMDVAFEAVNVGGKKWEVKVPELPILERTAYPFMINVDADGYHFEPLKGTVNVVGSNDVYVTTPKNPKIKSATITEEIKKEPEVVVEAAPIPKSKRGEKGIAQIAEELVAANKARIADMVVESKPAPVVEAVKPVVQVAKPVETKPVIETPVVSESLLPKIVVEPKVVVKGNKDDVVAAILEEAGLKPKNKITKKLSRFSLKN